MTQISNKLQEAFAFHQQGNLPEAYNLYSEILEAEPENDRVLNLMGILYQQLKEYEAADFCMKKAIQISPLIPYVEDLARLYIDMENYVSAIKLYENVLEHNKTYENYFNLAMAYKGCKNNEKARENYNTALELNPNGYEAYFNLAYLEINENNLPKAIEYYKKSLEIRPDDWEARYFLALAQMQMKDYKEGLINYEARMCRQSAMLSQAKIYPDLIKQKPVWNGEDLSSKILFTYYEAGFGDIIMFYRYMPILAKMCKKVIFQPQKSLVQLFKNNSYGAEVVGADEKIDNMYFDYHLPFLSLPLVLGLTGDDIFVNHQGYLKADKESVEYYKNKYCDNNGFKVGIKWKGKSFYDKERILNVEDFFRLLDLPDTKFYSFQTDDGSDEFAKIKEKYDAIDLGTTFSNFADTAAAIENMDLIISNDTSLVHLAGAMNKKCWVLLPYIYNWRWHTDLSKCDWYDSVRVFRQKMPNVWNDVFDEIEKELKILLKH